MIRNQKYLLPLDYLSAPALEKALEADCVEQFVVHTGEPLLPPLDWHPHFLPFLYLAIGHNALHIFDYLTQELTRPGVFNETIDTYTPLIEALMFGSREMFEKIVEKGADINAQNDFGQTVAMWAAATDNVEIIDYLIQRKALLHTSPSTCDTVFQLAIFNKSEQVCDYLLRYAENDLELLKKLYDEKKSLEKSTQAIYSVDLYFKPEYPFIENIELRLRSLIERLQFEKNMPMSSEVGISRKDKI